MSLKGMAASGRLVMKWGKISVIGFFDKDS
jgi:hypothetical protein